MIVIKAIEIVEVREDDWLFYITPKELINPHDIPTSVDVKVTGEMVRGLRYKTEDGREICIGMLKSVQEAIGLPYEVLRKMKEREIENYKELVERSGIIQDLRMGFGSYKQSIENMNFWKRLKALFVGYKL